MSEANEATHVVEELKKEVEATLEETQDADQPAPQTEATPPAQEEEDPVVVTLQVGYRKSGRPFLQVQGASNILEMKGLLWYADQELDRLMQGRLQTQHTLFASVEAKLDQAAALQKELLDAIRSLTQALKERRRS